MKHILFFIFIFFHISYASNTLELTSDNIKIESFPISYLHDDTNTLKINDILNNLKKFENTTNKASFGINHNTTWFKILIKNKTNLSKEIHLHSNFAYMSKEIDIFELSNNKELEHTSYYLFDEDISEKLLGSTLVYSFNIPSLGEKTILIKKTSLVHQLIDFNLYNDFYSKKAIINKSFFSMIIVLILFSLALYNMILFIFIKRKEFAYYSMYLFNAALGLFYMYGIIFNNLNIYGNNALWFNLTAILVSPLLILFVKSIFDTKNTKIHKILNSIIIIAVFLFITSFFNLEFVIKMIGIFFVYTFIVLLYTGIYFYKKKHPLSSLFLFAYIIYIIGMGVTIYMLTGHTSYTTFSFHASGLGLIFEALLFSYLINYRIRLLEENLSKHKHTLILKNKKAQMGDMIAAISHQLKQPLTSISSISTILQYKLVKDTKVSSSYLEEKLLKIDEKIIFLVKTIDDFINLFNPNKKDKNIDLRDVINKAVYLSDEDMLINDITIELNLNFYKKIKVYDNELLHVILNLIQNSKEAFIQNNIESRFIEITLDRVKEQTIIELRDNAGGILKENEDKVFDEFYTTKKDIEGSGLGLYLCKLILKEQLNGTLNLIKIDNGTIFRITLNE